MPGIGEVASKTTDAADSTIKRFKRAKKLTSYCGLVPSMFSSGERAAYGHITREGRSEVRHVAVQSVRAILRSKNSESKPLWKWYERIDRRRGSKTAVVALARKLIEIIFYVLRDWRPYNAQLLQRCRYQLTNWYRSYTLMVAAQNGHLSVIKVLIALL